MSSCAAPMPLGAHVVQCAVAPLVRAPPGSPGHHCRPAPTFARLGPGTGCTTASEPACTARTTAVTPSSSCASRPPRPCAAVPRPHASSPRLPSPFPHAPPSPSQPRPVVQQRPHHRDVARAAAATRSSDSKGRGARSWNSSGTLVRIHPQHPLHLPTPPGGHGVERALTCRLGRRLRRRRIRCGKS